MHTRCKSPVKEILSSETVAVGWWLLNVPSSSSLEQSQLCLPVFVAPLSSLLHLSAKGGHQLLVYRVRSGVKEMSPFSWKWDEFRFLHRGKAGQFHPAGAVMTTVTLFDQMARWHYRFLPLFALAGLYLPLNLTLYSLSAFPPDWLTSFQRKTIETINVSASDRTFASRNHVICDQNLQFLVSYQTSWWTLEGFVGEMLWNMLSRTIDPYSWRQESLHLPVFLGWLCGRRWSPECAGARRNGRAVFFHQAANRCFSTINTFQFDWANASFSENGSDGVEFLWETGQTQIHTGN